MRQDLRSDAILEGGDDLAPRRVILRIGGEAHQDVEPQADGIALDLDVAFLEDVQESHLDLAGQVRQLVDGEDGPVGPREQAVVHRQFVGQQVATACSLDGIEVADDVGAGDVRGGQLFDVALFPPQPIDGGVGPTLGDEILGIARDGGERIVVHLTAGDDRDLGIEEVHQLAENAALGLPAQAQEDEVLLGEEGVDDLRDDRLFVAHDAGKQFPPVLQGLQQVGTDLRTHRRLYPSALP